MPSVTALLAAHRTGDKRSLVALASALAGTVHDTPALPDDAVDLYDVVEDRGAELDGTWQQVRAARDYGQLTPAEYDYLAAAVGALKQEEDSE